jgi:TP901 family phage tail tape measure protein
MASVGTASVEVVADFAKFTTEFQKGLDAALRGVTVNMTAIGNQITQGISTAVTQANQTLRTIGQGVSSAVGQSVGEVANQVQTVGTASTSAASTAASASQSIADSFISAGQSITSVGENMTSSITTPILNVASSVISLASDFESNMNRVKAVTQATGSEFDLLRDQAKYLGAVTAYTASEAAQAMANLSTSGFSVKEILASMPAVLNQAAAGGITLADSADIAAGVLRSFGLDASQMGMVSDVLTKTFLSTATTITTLKESLKYAAPIAHSAGLSFTEVTAAIGLLGNAGIKGSMAGTGLNGAISNLLKPSKQVANKMEELGLKVKDTSGKMVSLTSILKQLEQAGATSADMVTLFGKNAGPKMMALLSQGSGALEKLTKELDAAGGTAAKVAKTQMEGLKGSMLILKSSVEGLAITIGDAGLLAFFNGFVNKVNTLVNVLIKLNPTILNTVVILAGLFAAIGPILLVIGKMATLIGKSINNLQRFWKWLKALRSVSYVWTALTGPIGVVIAVLIAVGVAAYVAYKKIKGFRDTVNRAFAAISVAASVLWANIKIAFAAMGVWFTNLWVSAQLLWQRMVPIFDRIGNALMAAWRSIVIPAAKGIVSTLATIGKSASDLWNSTLKPPIMAIIGLFTMLGSAIGGWFSKNAGPAFTIAGATIVWFWRSIAKPALSAFMTVLKALAVLIVAVFDNIIVPAIKIVVAYIGELWKTIVAWYQATKPIWTLFGSIVVSVLVAVWDAMKWLSTYIVSAWSSVSGSTKDTGNFLGTVFGYIIVIIKAVGAVAMWLWQNVFVPAFAGIRVVIGWLGVAIAVALPIVISVVKAIGATVIWLWQNVFSPAISAIVAIVQVLLSVFVWFWNTFGPLITAIGQLIWAIINFVVVLAFALFKLAVLALAVVVIAAIEIIKVVFIVLGTIVMWVWNTLLKPAFDMFMTIVTVVWAVIGPYVMLIAALFADYLGPVIGAFVSGVVGFFSGLWSAIVAIWNGITGVITGAVGVINSTSSGISNFVSNVVGFFAGMVNSISGAINSVTSKISGISGAITGALNGAGSWLYNAGQSIIQGLINGLDSMWQSLKNKASDIAGSIRDYFPFSPAKTGPLSGSGSPEIAGGKIISMVSDGMTAQIPDLRSVTGTVASALQLGVDQMVIPSLVSGSLPVAAAAGAGAYGNTYHLTVNALDPKSAARSVMDSINEWERTNGRGWRKPQA